MPGTRSGLQKFKGVILFFDSVLRSCLRDGVGGLEMSMLGGRAARMRGTLSEEQKKCWAWHRIDQPSKCFVAIYDSFFKPSNLKS